MHHSRESKCGLRLTNRIDYYNRDISYEFNSKVAKKHFKLNLTFPITTHRHTHIHYVIKNKPDK